MRRKQVPFLFLLSTACVFIYNGCGPEPSNGPNIVAEKAYCGSAISQTGTTVTITGSAGYFYRTPGALGLGAVSGTTKPIRYAEFHVVDSGGNIQQCGETDSSGNFSFTVTQGTGSLTIEIISRAYNSNSKVSVLNDPTNNGYYKITKSFTPNSTQNVGSVTASATGSLEGGAFNILDKILDANLFLKNKTSGCGTISGTYNSVAFSCSPFAPDYKAAVYWKPGFNPNTYLGSAADETLSFYDPDEDKIYICGGVSGDVNNSDTDHFDNSIIIHEYGHFLENHYSVSDSPGGSHSGTKAMDPRLMLSEGFQNFFQAAVQSLSTDPFYIDTEGNADGATGVLFYKSIEYKCNAGNNTCGSPFDAATTSGEGNFREFAISRALYDIADTNDDTLSTTVTENIDDKFAEIWTAFTALKTLPVHFRNIGLLYKIQATITGATNISSAYAGELQVADLSGYSSPNAGGSCTPSITSSAAINSPNTNDPSWPNNGALFLSTDSYDYVSSGGSTTFTLQYTPAGKDLDIHIYREEHILFYTATMVAADIRSSTQENGNISLSTSLAAGHYLILIHYYNGSGASPTYTLRANGVQLCPGS